MAKKPATPLYLSCVDTINELLAQMKFEPPLPSHKTRIDRSGRNVEWLRKAFKRGTTSADRDFAKLKQLLEVPDAAPVAEVPATPAKLEQLRTHAERQTLKRNTHSQSFGRPYRETRPT